MKIGSDSTSFYFGVSVCPASAETVSSFNPTWKSDRSSLIGADQPVQFLIFGFNSLGFILSCHWDAVASEA
jgi:hypothetical protein